MASIAVIDAKRLGIAGGVFWGISLFLMTIISLITGYASLFLVMISDIYPGYSITWFGSIVGLIYGFVDGFICLYVISWLYNKIRV